MHYIHSQPNIHMDFLENFCQKIDSEFQQYNVKLPSNLSKREKLESYIDWRHKMIHPKKRSFHISTQILGSQKKTKAIQSIKSDSIQGESLFKYQSRNIRDTFCKKGRFKHDALLNNWHIHHFHLDVDMESDGFVSRSEDHLYAVVTDSAIFAVCICPHGEYSNPKALSIIKHNWPHLFRSKYSPTTPDSTMKSDGDLIKKMRGKNALFPLKVAGETIVSGSTTATGASISCVMESDFIQFFLKGFERSITHDFIFKEIHVNNPRTTICDINVHLSPNLSLDSLIKKIRMNAYIPITIDCITH